MTGAGLIAFALLVPGVASLEPVRLLRGATAISAADAAWVLGTIIVLTTVELNARRVVALGVIALVVAGFATCQLPCGPRWSESTPRRPIFQPRVSRACR